MAHTLNITMRDIAKSMNVSVTTVSKVINKHSDISEKTRQEVLKKIDELGYVPNLLATNLRKNKANLVALVLSDISKPYFARVIASCEKTLESAGFFTLIFSSMENSDLEARFIQQIAAMNMAGIIIDPAQDSDPHKNALKQAGIPYVFSNRFLEPETDYYVAADNELAGYLATMHLFERKRGRPIVCVNGPNQISPTIQRFSGYQRAMKEIGAPLNEDFIYCNCFGLKDAYEVGKRIALSTCPPFSVFCSTDQLAVGVMRALYDSGLSIPNEVAVMGVDDIDMAEYFIPALTTVSLPKDLIGEESARMLISLIRGENLLETQVLLKPELIIRETT